MTAEKFKNEMGGCCACPGLVIKAQLAFDGPQDKSKPYNLGAAISDIVDALEEALPIMDLPKIG